MLPQVRIHRATSRLTTVATLLTEAIEAADPVAVDSLLFRASSLTDAAMGDVGLAAWMAQADTWARPMSTTGVAQAMVSVQTSLDLLRWQWQLTDTCASSRLLSYLDAISAALADVQMVVDGPPKRPVVDHRFLASAAMQAQAPISFDELMTAEELAAWSSEGEPDLADLDDADDGL